VGWAVLAPMVATRLAGRGLLRAAVLFLVVTAPLTLLYWGKDLVLAGPGPEHAAAIVLAILAAAAFLRRADLARVAGVIRGTLTARVTRVRYAAWAGSLAVIVLALTCASLAYAPARYDSWQRYWGSRYELERRDAPRADFRDMGASWKAIAEETEGRPAVIAYAGTNTPYPLSGSSFENRVRFVPRGSNARASLYDWGSTPSNGREPGDRASWLANLESERVRYLCVYGIASRENPDAAFPVEREWADRSPEELRLIWSADHARIYRRDTAAAEPAR
jgi:hypothetical protein